MTPPGDRQALYYPFHLCHERTLRSLLAEYSSVHFRDYMDLQVTAMGGATAYMDRMGNAHPELVASGRIVQGYSVSGPLDRDATAAVNRDLADETWRSEFHASLSSDRRFQRGLFNLTHGVRIGPATVPGPAALLRLVEASREHQPYSVQELQRLSGSRLSLEEGYDYEYALALVKTSASLVYTIRLSLKHELDTVTDSEAHFRLLERTCSREQVFLTNQRIVQEED